MKSTAAVPTSMSLECSKNQIFADKISSRVIHVPADVARDDLLLLQERDLCSWSFMPKIAPMRGMKTNWLNWLTECACLAFSPVLDCYPSLDEMKAREVRHIISRSSAQKGIVSSVHAPQIGERKRKLMHTRGRSSCSSNTSTTTTAWSTSSIIFIAYIFEFARYSSHRTSGPSYVLAYIRFGYWIWRYCNSFPSTVTRKQSIPFSIPR